MALGYFERLSQNSILVSYSKKILFFVGVTLLIIVLSTIPVMYSVTAQNETSPNTNNFTLVGQVNVRDLPKAVITTQPSVEIPFMRSDSRSYVEMEEDAIEARSATMALAASQLAIQESSTNLNIFTGFEGLDQFDGGAIPPDVQVAAGPNHIVEFINSHGKIWTKDGTPVSDFSLSSFFSAPSEFPFDPKIFFDTQSNRWFASVTSSSNIIRIAVSTTNDPTGTWIIYSASFGPFFPDQPRIGASNDKFVVSTNDFNAGGNFVGAHYFILDKNQMINGVTITNQQEVARDNTRFSIKPVQSLSSTSPLYMVSTNPGVNTVTLHTITGSPPSANIATLDLTIIIPLVPPGGIQQGTTNLIDTGGNRILDARWFEGDLWFTLNDLCLPTGDATARSCVHLVQIDTVTSTVSQDFFLGAAGFYYFYPAISIDSLGGLGVVFGFSNAATFPSLG